jgi:tetratricopeptide (TPR) repeat protein
VLRFLKENLLQFLKEHFLKAVLLVAVTGAMVGWLQGLVGGVLPSTEPPRCWIEERWQAAFRSEAPTNPGQFAILITRLAEDSDGSETQHLVEAFLGERGFRRLTTCQSVSLKGEDQNAAEEKAEAKADQLRVLRGADLVLWGEVADRGAVRVWMTAPTVPADMKMRPWVVDKGVLEPAFREQFAVALKAVVLANLARSGDAEEGKTFTDLMQPILARLRSLVAAPPAGLTDDALGSLLLAAGRTFRNYGDKVGDSASLGEAVSTYSAALKALSRDRVPLDWARTQSSLGHALVTLGERETGTARYEAAVAADHAAQEELTRDRFPRDWANTQEGLGWALFRLGEREGGTARLEEAVPAFRAALEELTREPASALLSADTENGLGAALFKLGEREGGTARLEEAVQAYRAALEVQTRERVPFDWAVAQNNLGNVLEGLGERESGTARLEEAVTGYRAVLEEWTRERTPFYWALAQTNLGESLVALGKRESGTARLMEAAGAYRAALEERARERVPFQWASTLNGLGNALEALGRRTAGAGPLDEAVAAHRAALEEWTRDRVPFFWAQAQNDLGNALEALGERESGTARLEEAVAAYAAALEVRTRERGPVPWAESVGGQGVALMSIADRTNDPITSAGSLRQIQAAYEVIGPGGDQLMAADLQMQLARAQAIHDRLEAAIKPPSQSHHEAIQKGKNQSRRLEAPHRPLASSR